MQGERRGWLWDSSRVPEERWLTTGEAAREIGVHPSTINRYVRDGELKPTTTTPGGHHRWKLSVLKQQLHKLAEQSSRDQQHRRIEEARQQEAQRRDAGRDTGR
jgi:excisionase family DNA binding protein